MQIKSRFCVAVLIAAILSCSPLMLANQVGAWSQFALATLTGSHMNLLEAERDMAIVQLAVYEVVNAIQPAYERSSLAIPPAPGASVEAAIVEATYQSLVALLPASADHTALDRKRTESLAAIPESPSKRDGIAAGAAAAASVLQWRKNDGCDWSDAFTPRTGFGEYQPTSEKPVVGPFAAKMRPFALESYAALRPPPPPPLDSPQMKRDLEEIAVWGSKDSSLRTPDQTEFALFHARPGIFSWNSVATQTADQVHMGEVQTAHMLAIVEETIVDAHFAAWEAKYYYRLWRPVTALRAGGGPLHLKVDPAWSPLIPTPMIPEYPCAHCSLGASVMTVLEGLAGTGPIDLAVESGGTTRHYRSFRQYAEEESASRMYAGVHYRWSNIVGDALGRQVGEIELAKAPRPLQAPVSNRQAALTLIQ